MTTTTTRAPRRDAAENRAALLLAAKAVLNRDPDASLETIAAEANLSRRAVYGHFATRDQLVTELVQQGVARVASALVGVHHPDPLVRIALIGARLWGEVDHVRVLAAFAVRGPLRLSVAEGLRPLRKQVLDAVRAGQKAGTMRDDIASETLARLIEAAAISVLDEATRTELSSEHGHQLVMRSALSLAGLGWRDSDKLIHETAELA